ncbi:hypothetical protein Avbf_17262 [Armadillidium vulgare]|nr:hypothetical protein Avbf_17262 [Armadillidium vulgare]
MVSCDFFDLLRRDIFPQLCFGSKMKTYQIREIQKYLNSVSFKDNEISVITPSSNYFATNDPSNLAFNVAKVALVREGSVVMGFPMVKNLSSFSTPFDDSISEVKKLSELSNPAKNDFHPAPVDLDEWKLSIQILSKYKRLLVKQQQYQLKYASVYDERCCDLQV